MEGNFANFVFALCGYGFCLFKYFNVTIKFGVNINIFTSLNLNNVKSLCEPTEGTT